MASNTEHSFIAIFTIFLGLALMVVCITLVNSNSFPKPESSRVDIIIQDRSIVATAVPRITSEFNSLADVGWYGSSYLMATCCLQLFFGKLYAEFQVKWVFLAALAVFEIGSIICAAAPSSVVLIVGRAVAGAGCAGLMSGAFIVSRRLQDDTTKNRKLTLSQMLRMFIPVHQLPKYTGALGGMSGISQIIAPTLGGTLTRYRSHNTQLTTPRCLYR